MSNGLGRGLSSLIPNKTNPPVELDDVNSQDKAKNNNGVVEIEVEKIKLNPMQPREKFTDTKLDELADSIKEYGIIQPLVVSYKNGEYELIAGERRLRASKQIGLKKVPIVIRNVDDLKKLEVALVENIQREDLNPIDMAHAYKRLIDNFDLSHEEAAKRVGKPRSSFSNVLRLLSLPEEVQLALINEKITEGHAKFILGLESEEKQMTLFRKILHNSLTVGDANAEAKRMGGTKAARIKINYNDKDKEFAFREFFGAKIEVKRKGKGGQIIINFFSEDELREITGKIKK
jgi:ParB family chromosome partitioning protein